MGLPRELLRSEGGKILLFVIDGLGGLPHPERGTTELEEARIPHLDRLARQSSVGRISILSPGLTPGSGPGHLSLFGYDPAAIDLGRGVLEALGSDYHLQPGEVAARGNFCTLDGEGIVRDRRAGRPPDEVSRGLCQRVSREVQLSGAEFQLLPGKEHRFTLVLRGDGLGHHLNDNDPQVEGRAPLPIEGADPASRRTAEIVTEFLAGACRVLAGETQATGMLLRGFSSLPPIETFQERYGVRAAAIAVYPMYRGVARLVGMEVLEAGPNLETQAQSARDHWNDFDFFFIHTKGADAAGHGGDFQEKVSVLEEIDRHVPGLVELGATVTIVTGDHSTPTVHREHSWHPVPVLLSSPRTIPVAATTFSERGVMGGELGVFSALDLLPLALAHAGRLDKYGA